MNPDSFYCSRCEKIPQIELAPKENELKILATCQCHRQLLKAKSFFKYYYNPESFQPSQAPNEVQNSYIKSLIQSYQDYKEKFLNNGIRIKNEAVNI